MRRRKTVAVRPGSGIGRWAILAAWSGLLAACGTPPPTGSAFPSNHAPDEAYRCVLRRLAFEGFQVVESSPEERTATALRRLDPGPDVGSAVWWRVEISVAPGPDRRTLVETRAGEALRPEGPWAPPGQALQGRLGRLSGECTW